MGRIVEREEEAEAAITGYEEPLAEVADVVAGNPIEEMTVGVAVPFTQAGDR